MASTEDVWADGNQLEDRLENQVENCVLVWSEPGRAATYILHREQRVMGVSEIASEIEAFGVRFRGRPGKAVSDGLRGQVARGRVRKIGRNQYVAGSVSTKTLQRTHRMLLDRGAGIPRSWRSWT
jgi:hypothetical protein